MLSLGCSVSIVGTLQRRDVGDVYAKLATWFDTLLLALSRRHANVAFVPTTSLFNPDDFKADGVHLKTATKQRFIEPVVTRYWRDRCAASDAALATLVTDVGHLRQQMLQIGELLLSQQTESSNALGTRINGLQEQVNGSVAAKDAEIAAPTTTEVAEVSARVDDVDTRLQKVESDLQSLSITSTRPSKPGSNQRRKARGEAASGGTASSSKRELDDN